MLGVTQRREAKCPNLLSGEPATSARVDALMTANLCRQPGPGGDIQLGEHVRSTRALIASASTMARSTAGRPLTVARSASEKPDPRIEATRSACRVSSGRKLSRRKPTRRSQVQSLDQRRDLRITPVDSRHGRQPAHVLDATAYCGTRRAAPRPPRGQRWPEGPPWTNRGCAATCPPPYCGTRGSPLLAGAPPGWLGCRGWLADVCFRVAAVGAGARLTVLGDLRAGARVGRFPG